MIENKVKVYFPGLNGLQFFAAFLVVASHVELLKSRNGFENDYYTRTFLELCGSAVTFFFVLSGFLITYLLIIEKNLTGKISLSQFYLRRIFKNLVAIIHGLSGRLLPFSVYSLSPKFNLRGIIC